MDDTDKDSQNDVEKQRDTQHDWKEVIEQFFVYALFHRGPGRRRSFARHDSNRSAYPQRIAQRHASEPAGYLVNALPAQYPVEPWLRLVGRFFQAKRTQHEAALANRAARGACDCVFQAGTLTAYSDSVLDICGPHRGTLPLHEVL
jgi:hypothetical protein